MANKFRSIADGVADIVKDKQEAYGDSFGKSGECLRQMYPQGIDPEQYDDLLTVARILDKLFRIANNPTAFDENPYQDIVGYGLLGMHRHNPAPEPLQPLPPQSLAQEKPKKDWDDIDIDD
jgi:hypothetical protein|tara:strand:- start:68 stop:430 length:363 start_codon:yes stop_codon:yes gene_type:complete